MELLTLKHDTGHSTVILYFFFDFNDAAKQTVDGMVRSLILQLAKQSQGVPDAISGMYSTHGQDRSPPTMPTTAEWTVLLTRMLEATSKCYIIMDALDECFEDSLLINTVQLLLNTSESGIKWLLTSRSSEDLIMDLQNFAVLPINIPKESVDKDIELYTEFRLGAEVKLQAFSDESQALIVSTISSKAEGMFRWGQCQLHTLKRLKDRFKNFVAILDQIPQDLNLTYAGILFGLESSDEWTLIARILAFVAFSALPPTIAEIVEFVIIESEGDVIRPNGRFENCRDILTLASCFISVENETLNLSHKSVKDFFDIQMKGGTILVRHLLRDMNLDAGVSATPLLPEAYMAKRCLGYLSLPTTPVRQLSFSKDIKHPNAKHLETLLRELPFLEYAATKWPYHARTEKEQSLARWDMPVVLRFGRCSNLWKAWLMLQLADIWETQLSLAHTICEAIISSADVVGWANNFWQMRQAYRVGSEEQTQHVRSTSVISIDPKQDVYGFHVAGRVCLDMAVVLLEVALQKSLYESFQAQIDTVESSEALEAVIVALEKLSKATKNRMGLGYHIAVITCLDHVCLEHRLRGTPAPH